MGFFNIYGGIENLNNNNNTSNNNLKNQSFEDKELFKKAEEILNKTSEGNKKSNLKVYSKLEKSEKSIKFEEIEKLCQENIWL